ncbi:MAG: ATP-binding protein [Acidobacteriaceae bacterium]
MRDSQPEPDEHGASPMVKLGESELAYLADYVPQMVWMCTPDGANIYFNQRWLDYTGMTREESYGAGWNIPFHPDERAIAWKAWDEAVRTGRTYQVENRLRAADGTYRWFLVRGEPLKGADGRVVKWFGTCTDIHDMKHAQEALLRSEKLASAGRMAAAVAHEINNPLAAVTNLIYLARNEEDIGPIRTYLEQAEAELNRVAHIARQSLGFYRESTGPVPTYIQGLIESAIGILKAKISSKGAHVETRWGEDVCLPVVAGEIRQVFANLLANSLDAVPQGGTIKVRTAVAFNHKKQVSCFRVTIADNGAGIPRHVRDKLFEPFFTTKGTTGTGLGLWVSKQILDKHNGTIRMRSRTGCPQAGTVFCITFADITPKSGECVD